MRSLASVRWSSSAATTRARGVRRPSLSRGRPATTNTQGPLLRATRPPQSKGRGWSATPLLHMPAGHTLHGRHHARASSPGGASAVHRESLGREEVGATILEAHRHWILAPLGGRRGTWTPSTRRRAARHGRSGRSLPGRSGAPEAVAATPQHHSHLRPRRAGERAPPSGPLEEEAMDLSDTAAPPPPRRRLRLSRR
jgi:hypothetical protein